MIEYCHQKNPSVACWNDDETAFIVKDPKRLAASHISQYFKHSNFQSFVRQLNTYGFRSFNNTFHHENFIRGRPDLLGNIKRTGTRKKRTPEEEKLKEQDIASSSPSDSLAEMENRLQESFKVHMDEISSKLDLLISALVPGCGSQEHLLVSLTHKSKRCRVDPPPRVRSPASVSDTESTLSNRFPKVLVEYLHTHKALHFQEERSMGKEVQKCQAIASEIGGTASRVEDVMEEIIGYEEEEGSKQQLKPNKLIEELELDDGGFGELIDDVLENDDMVAMNSLFGVSESSVSLPLKRSQKSSNKKEEEDGSVTLEIETSSDQESSLQEDNLGDIYEDHQQTTRSTHVINAEGTKEHPAPIQVVQADIPDQPLISTVVTGQHLSATDQNDEEVAFGTCAPVTAVAVPDLKQGLSRVKVLGAAIITLTLIAIIIWSSVMFGKTSNQGNDDSLPLEDSLDQNAAISSKTEWSSHGRNHSFEKRKWLNSDTSDSFDQEQEILENKDEIPDDGSLSRYHHPPDTLEDEDGSHSVPAIKKSLPFQAKPPLSHSDNPPSDQDSSKIHGTKASLVKGQNQISTMDISIDGKVFHCLTSSG